ncbi:restriction endonuclease subunit S [Thiohalobacter sp. IOR34]|uniref:restriction endonuclease subunit S n=1 Tax=Thiohalobacter sp. IOR34 TaxID=3057176 RepID=UPI0025AFABAF|nr:restriction endonuclease subunit S [Thiohalobacter sp. IOR34]WJW74721.1 restriction endonuclease subunit S [Thiohalobacter sp. IOR34]
MNWPFTTIASVTQRTSTRDPRARPNDLFQYIDIASIDRDQKEIVQAAELKGADAPSRARKVVKAGDILVSTVRPNLNTVAIVPPELDGQIASTGFCVLRPDRELVDERYLFYFVRTAEFIDALTSKVRGAHYPAVSDRDVKNTELPLPPLKEQRRIVEILDQADALRKQRADADKKAARILPALFYQMFGDPLLNPRGWDVQPFGALKGETGLVTDGDWILSENMDESGNVRLLQLADIGIGRFLDKSRKFITDEKFDELGCTEVLAGDVLVSRMAEPIGRACIVPELEQRAITAVDITIVRVGQSVALPEYVVCLCNMPFFLGKAQAAASGTTRGRITRRNLEKIPVPIPPVEMQKEFACRYNEMEKMSVGMMNAHQFLESLFNSLMRSAFSGELTAGWRKAHTKELLREMESQAQAIS